MTAREDEDDCTECTEGEQDAPAPGELGKEDGSEKRHDGDADISADGGESSDLAPHTRRADLRYVGDSDRDVGTGADARDESRDDEPAESGSAGAEDHADAENPQCGSEREDPALSRGEGRAEELADDQTDQADGDGPRCCRRAHAEVGDDDRQGCADDHDVEEGEKERATKVCEQAIGPGPAGESV